MLMNERLERTRQELIEETREKAPTIHVKNGLVQQLRKMNIGRIFSKHVANGYDEDFMQTEIKKYLKNNTKALADLDPYDVDILLDEIIYEVLP